MALFRKFFYRKPPDGLLEISERVYVFDCCFTTDILEDDEYKVYIEGIVRQLHDYFPDSSFMVFNFREGQKQSQIESILCDYDMIVMDYPRHYEGCPLLTMEMIHHFIRSSENWLALMQKNVLLMHCERGGWPVLAFMLAALLIYRKNFTGEQKTLDMIYKQAPRELLQLMSPLNPVPSQLRYLQYISRRNVGSQWPPQDRALTLDCVILRAIPNMDPEGGCRPIFRIYGQDPLMVADRAPKVLFSTPKRSRFVRHYKEAVCDLIKIDIHCHIQGDVVMECINVESDLEREQMMFRVMFNTAFIRSNILMLNRDEIDTLWNVKDQFPKDFRAEVLFSEMNSTSSLATVDLLGLEEKGGLPEEAFSKVQEIFSNVDWIDTNSDAAINMLQHITTLKQNLEIVSPRRAEIGRVLESPLEKVQDKSKIKESEHMSRSLRSLTLGGHYMPSVKPSPDANSIGEKDEKLELATPQQSILSMRSSLDSNSTSEKVEPLQLVVGSQSMGSSTPSTDVNSIRKKVDSQDIQVTLQLPAQSKIISPRVSNISRSSPYHSTPSTIGISALLHDHVASNDGEAISPMELSSSATSSTVTNVNRPIQISHLSSLSPPSPESSSILLECSKKAPIISEKSSATDPPPQPMSKSTNSSSTYYPKISSDRNHSLTNPACPLPLSSPPWSSSSLSIKNSSSTLPSPPPSSTITNCSSSVLSAASSSVISGPPPPPPPPPPCSRSELGSASVASVQTPLPLPSSAQKDSLLNNSTHIPPVPPPPAPFAKGLSKHCGASLPSQSGVGNGNVPPVPGPPSGSPFSAKGRGLLRSSPRNQAQPRRANLKPYHWLKLTRAMQGSLWAEAQKSDEASKPPEFDLLELESLFSAAAPNTGPGSTGGKSNRRTLGVKSDKVQMIELRRAYNCEIMLSKVKIPLSELMSSVLALDDSALDVDQVENLIKFCPTKEETELLKFFLELIKVPRVESKLRVFSFKMQFHTQVSDLRSNLNVVNSAAEEIRSSIKLKKIMQTILSLGNALNHGTARGSAIGFRLDSLLKLTDTRARNNKMTLMHYLCKVLAEKLPELLDFPQDLKSLEAATKIQLKYLAEEMQAISKGLEKVMQELTASENDGQVSKIFRPRLKSFLGSAESEVRSLALLYTTVGRNADALALYFGEDPVRCPFEQVVSTLLNFSKMFVRAHNENCRQLELEKKMAENEKLKMEASRKESEKLLQTPIKSGSIK